MLESFCFEANVNNEFLENECLESQNSYLDKDFLADHSCTFEDSCPIKRMAYFSNIHMEDCGISSTNQLTQDGVDMLQPEFYDAEWLFGPNMFLRKLL